MTIITFNQCNAVINPIIKNNNNIRVRLLTYLHMLHHVKFRSYDGSIAAVQ